MGFSIQGKLDPAFDISGAFNLESTRTLTDESSGFGKALVGQTGAAASIVAGAAAGGTNGTFLISQFNSATSVDVVNAAAVIPDGNNGAISWTERDPFVLEDHV